MIEQLRHEQGFAIVPMRRILNGSKSGYDSKHNLPIAPSLLDQNFTISGPNQVWVAESPTPTEQGWLYLAGIKDLWDKEIVGYAMSHRMTQDLVGRAFFRAMTARRPQAGLIHHSDRGSQYCSKNYQKLLKQFGVTVSMSRKGNCSDNAPMESFFGTLKNELVHHRKFLTRQEAISLISEYIEVFYNRQRRRAKLGNLSPLAFWKKFISRQRAA